MGAAVRQVGDTPQGYVHRSRTPEGHHDGPDRAASQGRIVNEETRRATESTWPRSGRACNRRPVLHADETPVAMLKPGKGKPHKAYLWSYCTTSFEPVKAVVYDFAETRAGQNAREFLRTCEAVEPWRGTLVCDDYSGYKGMLEQGVTEAGCLTHGRRKFHELWDPHQSPIGEQALKYFAALYDVEREARDRTPDERERLAIPLPDGGEVARVPSACYQAVGFFQRCGSSSSIRPLGWLGSRSRTSLR